jgi:hypothetical protein
LSLKQPFGGGIAGRSAFWLWHQLLTFLILMFSPDGADDEA